MEAGIGFLVFLLMIIPFILKVRKELKNTTARPYATGTGSKPDESETVVSDLENDASELRKNEAKIPKESEYFTYETMDDNVEKTRPTASQSENSTLQNVDNEEEEKLGITLSQEEVYKGIIYSEILKRKFN